VFDTLTDSFTTAIRKIRFHDDEKALKKALAELKKALLKADVHHKVVKELIDRVEELVLTDARFFRIELDAMRPPQGRQRTHRPRRARYEKSGHR